MRKLLMSGLFLCIAAAAPVAAQVAINQGDNRIDVSIDKKPFTTFFYGPTAPKPYLYPLRAPSGISVTRGFPMDPHPGDSTDHPHQRSLWFAHSAVNGYDYWNNEFSYPQEKVGHIFVTKINKITGGSKKGEIVETSEWKQHDGKAVLTENRTMTFYSGGPNRMVDFDITLTALDNVTFADAKDGVFGIRVASGLEEPGPKSPKEPKRTGVMTNAEGLKTEAECWGKRSNWMDYSGTVDGQQVGIAIFDHPGNPRHPVYWHARGYGLFANNIFGRREFTKGAEPDGSMNLKPGEQIRFRYRVVIHPGSATDAGISGLYEKYAASRGL
jgi:hypothetical protein